MKGLVQLARELAQPPEAQEAFAQRVSVSLGEAEGQRVRELEALIARQHARASSPR